jgi:hypothetical protein
MLYTHISIVSACSIFFFVCNTRRTSEYGMSWLDRVVEKVYHHGCQFCFRIDPSAPSDALIFIESFILFLFAGWNSLDCVNLCYTAW